MKPCKGYKSLSGGWSHTQVLHGLCLTPLCKTTIPGKSYYLETYVCTCRCVESARRNLLQQTQSTIAEHVGVDFVINVPQNLCLSLGRGGATFLCEYATLAIENTTAVKRQREGRKDTRAKRSKRHLHWVYHKEKPLMQ